MDVTSPAQIKALPHTLTFGVGLLLGIGLILSPMTKHRSLPCSSCFLCCSFFTETSAEETPNERIVNRLSGKRFEECW